MPRITLTLTDALVERLRYLSEHYQTPIATLAAQMVNDTTALCEDTLACEACAEIAWLASVTPAGTA